MFDPVLSVDYVVVTHKEGSNDWLICTISNGTDMHQEKQR